VYRSEVAKEVGLSRRKEFQKREVTREIYSKDIVWIG